MVANGIANSKIVLALVAGGERELERLAIAAIVEEGWSRILTPAWLSRNHTTNELFLLNVQSVFQPAAASAMDGHTGSASGDNDRTVQNHAETIVVQQDMKPVVGLRLTALHRQIPGNRFWQSE